MKNEKSKKKKILEEIDRAIMFEEMAVPIYTSHFKNALFWSKIDPRKKDEIIKGLKTLSVESKGHIVLLRKVKKIFFKEN